jgi:DNA-binding XRE family transcriptional regulator
MRQTATQLKGGDTMERTNLKLFRVAQKMTQAEFAEKIDPPTD